MMIMATMAMIKIIKMINEENKVKIKSTICMVQ